MKANQGGLAQLIATSSNVVMISAAATLRLDQRHVLANGSTALGGAFSITLPPVSECAGMIFTIWCEVIANAATVTVQDQDESEGWSDVALTTTADHLVVVSDGRHWITLADVST